MKPDPVRAIADAVLYEGYILWPYRRSALKNQRRFTFGGVYPPAHSAAHPDDPCVMQTEVLLSGRADTPVAVDVRFLQIVRRTVRERRGDQLHDVGELTVAGERHLTWEEAVEREVHAAWDLESLREMRVVSIEIGGGCETEELGDESGAVAGALVRSWQDLRGELRVRAVPVTAGLWRLTAGIENLTAFSSGDRQRALEHTFCSTHTLLQSPGGSFISSTDPPAELEHEAAACANLGTWPVLVGEPADCSTMLSSPIILEDHPRVAPQSPGDLFDGGEIDQLLILNILTLTDEEKAEMAASDPRAREILERTERLSPEQMMALHGTVRELGMAR